MKVLIFILAFLPTLSFAQCDTLVGAPAHKTSTIFQAASDHLGIIFHSKLDGGSYLLYKDPTGLFTLRISLSTETSLEGSEVIITHKKITSIFIEAPADQIEKLYKAFFEPLSRDCGKDATPTLRIWNNQKIAHYSLGERQGIKLGVIEVEKI